MIKAKITQADITKANKLRYTHSNLQVRRRMAVIFFSGLNKSRGEICLLAGVSSTTVTTTLKLYCKGGLQAIQDIAHRKPVSELQQHASKILTHFESFPPSTAIEAKKQIAQLTGINRNVSRIKVFLHRNGLKPRKTAAIPAKANPDEQEHFKKKIWSRDY